MSLPSQEPETGLESCGQCVKTKEALIPYLLLAAALAGGLLWHESELVPGLGRTVTSGQIAVGGPYALTDQDGKPRASSDFHGKYQLVYFGYTFCPDVCPTTLGVMAEALDKMGADQNRIVPVFITIDPERDIADGAEAIYGGVRAALCRPDRQRRSRLRQVEKEYPRLCQEAAHGGRQLRHGPFQRDVSDGPGRQAGQLLRRSDFSRKIWRKISRQKSRASAAASRSARRRRSACCASGRRSSWRRRRRAPA